MLSAPTLVALAATLSLANAGKYLHFPPVSRLYELNGLSDRFFKESDSCVQSCLTKHKSTEMTPCPVWDTGCLCIFNSYNDVWMNCVLKDCPQFAKDVEAKGVAACTKAGVPNEEVLLFSKSVKAEIEKAMAHAPKAHPVEDKIEAKAETKIDAPKAEKAEHKTDAHKEHKTEPKTDAHKEHKTEPKTDASKDMHPKESQAGSHSHASHEHHSTKVASENLGLGVAVAASAKVSNPVASSTLRTEKSNTAVQDHAECTLVCASAHAPATKADAEKLKPTAAAPQVQPTVEELASGSARTKIAPFAAALCFVVGMCVI